MDWRSLRKHYLRFYFSTNKVIGVPGFSGFIRTPWFAIGFAYNGFRQRNDFLWDGFAFGWGHPKGWKVNPEDLDNLYRHRSEKLCIFKPHPLFPDTSTQEIEEYRKAGIISG